MTVSAVSSTTAADTAAIEEAMGAVVHQFAMGIVGQGNILNQTVEQAFGSESPMEKAKNIDIA